MPANKNQAKESLSRVCLVTVGATAPFRGLLQALLQPAVLETFKKLNYDEIHIQCGTDLDWFNEQIQVQKLDSIHGLHFQTIGYSRALVDLMKRCRAEEGVRRTGVVISHAGSGTVLEALKLQVPLVVVPNEGLLGNHQLELADALQEEGSAIKGNLEDIVGAIIKAKEYADTLELDRAPPYKEPAFPVPEEERCKLFDWAVLSCYPDALAKQVR